MYNQQLEAQGRSASIDRESEKEVLHDIDYLANLEKVQSFMFLHSHFNDDYKWAQQEKNRLKFMVRHMIFSKDVECDTDA